MGHFFIELFQQTLGIGFLLYLVLLPAFAPRLVCPVLIPLERPRCHDLDGGPARVARREAGVLGGGKGYIGERNIVAVRGGEKILNLATVICTRVDPEVGFRQRQVLRRVLQADIQTDAGHGALHLAQFVLVERLVGRVIRQ